MHSSGLGSFFVLHGRKPVPKGRTWAAGVHPNADTSLSRAEAPTVGQLLALTKGSLGGVHVVGVQNTEALGRPSAGQGQDKAVAAVRAHTESRKHGG